MMYRQTDKGVLISPLSFFENEGGYTETQKQQDDLINGKVIPVTSPDSPQGCETSRLPHFL
jgi:hypothetical protein